MLRSLVWRDLHLALYHGDTLLPQLFFVLLTISEQRTQSVELFSTALAVLNDITRRLAKCLISRIYIHE